MTSDNRVHGNINKENSRQRLDMTKSYESQYQKHIIKRGGSYCSKLKFDVAPDKGCGYFVQPAVSLDIVIEWLRSENFSVRNYQQGLYVLNNKILTPAAILIFANNLRLKKHLNIFNMG